MKKILLTPYVPNAVDLKHPLAVFDKPSTPKEKRDIFVYFRGRCTPSAENYVGKIMRHALVRSPSPRHCEPNDCDVCHSRNSGGNETSSADGCSSHDTLSQDDRGTLEQNAMAASVV